MEPLFTVNPKKEHPEPSNFDKNLEMTLYLRSRRIYVYSVYVFDNDEKLVRQDMELSGVMSAWLNFFSQMVWPTLGKGTSNKEELILTDDMFLEILYKRLWPATKMDFEKLFLEHDIECAWAL